MKAVTETRRPWTALAVILCAALALPAAGKPAGSGYKVKTIISDTDGNPGHARMVNVWGLAFLPTGPFWSANNGTGTSSLFDQNGTAQTFFVTVPGTGADTGNPTGVVANTTGAFNGDLFIFVAEDGLITGWKPADGATAVVEKDNSGAGASYKGVAIGKNDDANVLYAANFASGQVEAYDSTFAPATLAGNFTDPNAVAGYVPFNVEVINGKVFVAYARKQAGAEDEDHGAGLGYIDVFNTDGTFVKRFASGSDVKSGGRKELDAPWGMTVAPNGFGRFGKKLLVGNFGSGQIAAFDPKNGKFLGLLRDKKGKPIVIDGLWDITPGGGGTSNGDPHKLYFSAGPEDETHGRFGVISH